ncbi:hypothetical protein SPSYN_00795 [Sporotomaculum syntrophicum]|uniref:Uncharacterized protein n=1 Tax=Sporotomaculum syntrophicum TaxID=182264 RepID=A0A9D2WR16_9FIRM|nr:hypothetical protein [Sporotomaculum syntrophicum]KAF1086057.1 hypothetical protein SPSYN_00795 [Sporotomaculum syntrophicum]
MTDYMKRYLHVVGGLLGALGVVFVVIKLVTYADQIKFSEFGVSTLLALLSLAVVYGLASIILAFAWRDLLKHLNLRVDTRWAIWTHGTSQLAKYVPGNIFHLAGRQAIGVAAGLPAWPLAKSAIWELGTLSVTGSLFVLLVLPFFVAEITSLLALFIFFVFFLACVCVIYRWFSPLVARAMSIYAVFHVLSGTVFFVVLCIILPSNLEISALFAGICGAYVVAWLAGLVTPGAPAGAGVREFVLFAILHTVVSEADLLAAIVLGRSVTVVGDVVYYFIALGMRKKEFNANADGLSSVKYDDL